ncbi:alpha/beta fold hydrolase [Subtercola sp. YIM 133946]|uniref:alpha/beta fold hydrolase n=1 Tax=Subtercola sp. YIM 133946 TaxID=3118909 RepID=UPI002F92CF67
MVAGVVMIGPVVDPRARTLLRQGAGLIRDAAPEPLRTNLMVAFDYARCGPSWFLAETRAMLAYPTHERITALTQPLLVIRGAHDSIARPNWAGRLSSQVTRGSVETTAGHRHNVVHSLPSEVALRIGRFADTLPDMVRRP